MKTDVLVLEKEQVETLEFPEQEILQNEDEKISRIVALKRALWLGNLERIKVKIYFADRIKKYLIETTIWGITEERIILKRGVTIPIHRVLQVT